MAAFEVLALDTATPQIRAPGVSDTYTFPRQALFLAGTTAAPGIAQTSDDNTGMWWPAADTLAWSLGGAEQMRLTSTGLGIGTSSPQSRLHSYSALGTAEIVQDAATAFRIIANNGTNYIQSGTALSSDSKAPLVFSSMFGVTEWMRLDSSGNLGLGVTPSAWGALGYVTALQLNNRGAYVAGTSNTYSSAPFLYVGNNAFYDDVAGVFKYVTTNTSAQYLQSASSHIWYTAPSGTAGTAISFTQAMTLDASGNLGIGITNPSVKLHVSGTGDQKIYISTFTSGSPELQLRAEGLNGGAITYDRGDQTLRLSNAGVVSAYASTSGSFVVGTAALATTATDGFLYVPTCAGTPTGTPTTQTGTAPIVVDTTNNKLYFYSGGSWVAAN